MEWKRYALKSNFNRFYAAKRGYKNDRAIRVDLYVTSRQLTSISGARCPTTAHHACAVRTTLHLMLLRGITRDDALFSRIIETNEKYYFKILKLNIYDLYTITKIKIIK